MSSNKALKILKEALENTEEITNVAKTLDSIIVIDDFNLSSDPFADVSRLPKSVNSYKTLIAHLKNLKVQISKKPQDIANKDFELAKSGMLKQYKLFACALSAMKRWSGRDSSKEISGTRKAHARRIVEWAKDNVEDTMSSNGKTMWKAAFSQNSDRMVSIVMLIIALIDRHDSDDESSESSGDDRSSRSGNSGVLEVESTTKSRENKKKKSSSTAKTSALDLNLLNYTLQTANNAENTGNEVESPAKSGNTTDVFSSAEGTLNNVD